MLTLISILLPAYNVGKYLTQCLESILSQNLDNCEIIIVDDGSEDETVEICDDYLHKYPNLIKVIHKKNGGLLSARRIGIKHANGTYCMFVDSDDYLMTGAIQTIKDKLNQYNYPDIMIYNYMIEYEGTGKRRENEEICYNDILFDDSNKGILYDKLIADNSLNAIWRKIIKTTLLLSDPKDYNRNINNSYGEDLLQSLYPLTYSKHILCINDILYVYRINNTSMIRTYTISTLRRKESDDEVNETFRQYMYVWHKDDLKYKRIFETRSINNVLHNICFTMMNVPVFGYEREKLYSLIDEIVKIKKLKECFTCYKDNVIKKNFLRIIMNRNYMVLHVIMRLLRFR